VGWTCAVSAGTESVGLGLIVWVGTGKLQAEISATSKRDSDRNLSVFNCAFLIAMKINPMQFDLLKPVEKQGFELVI
jgi:hypothetical protein